MVKARADLHLHSTHSDGVYTPRQLVDMANELGLGGISLTDHDTISGNKEFLMSGEESRLDCIPGVEISTDYQGFELHLLGYFVPSESSELEEKLTEFRDERHTRFPKMAQKLRDLGIDIPESDVEHIIRTAASPGRPHLARILVEMGIVKSIDEAFEKYLAEGRPAYVRRKRPGVVYGIQLLREIGAVPVLAHPLYYSGEDLRILLTDLRGAGLIGVEAVYNYSRDTSVEEDMLQVRQAAKGLGLIETGGTDFHGDDSHNALGSLTVPIMVINQLRRAADEIKSPRQRKMQKP